MAGLLAAGVLSERYDKVTVYDRDTLPDGPLPRRGVPQSRQGHGLTVRGADVLAELLPGFRDEMVAAGAVVCDMQRDLHLHFDGYRLKSALSGLTLFAMTRPAIEDLVRRRVRALDGVSVIDGTDVTGLLAAGGRVRGVSVRPARAPAADAGSGTAGDGETVSADLVVDAAGRGSRAGRWLAELGYPVPKESQVRAGVVYVSRHYKTGPWEPGERVGAVTAPYPGQHRGGGVVRQEGDKSVVILFGMVGEEPPLDDAGLLAYAESLDIPDVADVIRESEPLDEPARMRHPGSRRQHYEKLPRHLGGFLVTGDALCSFNPVYGQGMTVAALEALGLRRLLAASDDDADLPRRYFRAAARLTAEAWTMSAAGDLRFPQAEGKRMPADRVFHAYMDLYRAAASVDPALSEAFVRVASMLDSPLRLLSPGVVVRVLRLAGQGRAAHRAAAG